ncbi:winged helix-turn-helix domain-containing tetratricopeptide repeat protein [Bradyrhizobium sp. CB3481]|uniref:winged helix-turn-helix domain-containing tetratricopeptide repeat protein n=1 Tax=Bradyrhizobium sp. CB3481 TaxID=3039158 RepID=UPI0024B223AB|nr:winged helix-turn-helix domain-containing tetratricopeptide repeat protein [Bradyrhizobium sp. CB3481]WFU13987.1 winged helix-turn-helix domain-containing tetratricopeptide repeat protein [Bradyrhizobium sp. CB3481]
MQFLFADYVLDLNRRELTRGSAAIAIGPRVFDLLVYLVQARDRVVTRDELLDTVWSGRIVSESTLTSHINAVRKAIGDSGQEQRLIRTIARKGLRFVGEVEARSPDSAVIRNAEQANSNERQEPSLPDKPSIAILPFQNLSGDPEQEYFADGVVEDIILALSRIRWLFVIARNSSFTYKGRAVDVRQVGRELGVRYVLEGSVRKAATRVRITGQLIDATNGVHLWAERFEGTLDDIFELQDTVAAGVVSAIAPQLELAEIERASRKPTESLHAYDYYLRGLTKFHLASRAGLDEALPLFYKAIELDAEFASAYGMAAWCYYWRKMNRWLDDREADGNEAARLCRHAVTLGKNDAVALTRGGHAWPHFGGDLESCVTYVDRAMVLNPNLSTIWYLGGYQRISLGRHDSAIEYFTRAMRLSPLDPETFQMQTGIAMGHLYSGRFDAAVACLEMAWREVPNVLRVAAFMAASHALAGREEEARQAMHHVRRLDPTLRIGKLDDWLLVQPKDFAVAAEGLRRAGLPE